MSKLPGNLRWNLVVALPWLFMASLSHHLFDSADGG
jgi:hypothetical protein